MVDFGIRAPRRTELISSERLTEVSALFQFTDETAGIKFLSEFTNWPRHETAIDIKPWDGERRSTATKIYKQSVDDILCLIDAVIAVNLTSRPKEELVTEFYRMVDMWQVSKGAQLGKLACKLVTGLINRPPMGIEWEKCFLPYMLSRKKRYAGHKWAGNPNTGKKKPPQKKVFFLVYLSLNQAKSKTRNYL